MKIHRQGLTLLELLVSLAILSILTAIALPSFGSILINKRSEVVVKSLASAVAIAKTAAITGRQTVTLCKSSSGLSCSGNWKDGVIVFTDRNKDRIINQEDTLIRYFTFPSSEGELSWNAFQNRQYLQFTQEGFTRYQNGNFTYCPFRDKPEFARQLIINRTARTRFAVDSDGDGIRENSRGKPIKC